MTQIICILKFCRFLVENTENPVQFYLEAHENLIEST